MNILSGKSKLKFNDNGKLIGFSTKKGEEYIGLNPFKICVQGEPEGQFSELASANCLLSEQFNFVKKIRIGNGYTFIYHNEKYSLKTEIEITPVDDTGVFRIVSKITNQGKNVVDITRFSSAFVTAFGGNIQEKAPDYKVHYFESAWHAEARYRQKSIADLGLTLVSTHFMSKSFTLLSQGAYSTSKYFPLMCVENKKARKTWFINSECEGGWRIQLGHAAGYIQQNAGWYIESNAISASDIGTSLMLNSGESYTSPAVLVGSVNGGFDETVEALTKARRVLYKSEKSPLMFNDYMNCLWCNVNENITQKLADKAAALGVEGYCIDSGWYAPLNSLYGRLGDWNESLERFPSGVKGIMKYIKDLGLVPGVWTELEVCSDNADAFSLPDEFFICKNGKRVGGGERFFFDMRNPAVCEFLTQKVHALYQAGVRYIKNDFNAALRWITDANVIAENQRAAMSFYRSLKDKFPDLYFENCGSGAMRADYGTLKNFCNQSTSDQEIYYFNPPIVQGMLANVLPETAGVWSYPYPNLFDVRDNVKALEIESEKQSDGRQTVFNMVNGIAGNLYLSGRIEYADEKNTQLIKEGVDFFKEIRAFKERATAVYPNGLADISSLGEFATLGLINYEKTKMYLFFWRFGGVKSEFFVPLKKWMKNGAMVKRVYPKNYDIDCKIVNDKLVIKAGKQYSAAIFEINF